MSVGPTDGRTINPSHCAFTYLRVSRLLTAIIAGSLLRGGEGGAGTGADGAAERGKKEIAPVPPTTSNFFPLSLSAGDGDAAHPYRPPKERTTHAEPMDLGEACLFVFVVKSVVVFGCTSLVGWMAYRRTDGNFIFIDMQDAEAIC